MHGGCFERVTILRICTRESPSIMGGCASGERALALRCLLQGLAHAGLYSRIKSKIQPGRAYNPCPDQLQRDRCERLVEQSRERGEIERFEHCRCFEKMILARNQAGELVANETLRQMFAFVVLAWGGRGRG